MRKLLPLVFAGSIALLVLATPVAYKRWHDKGHRNVHVVETGILYRSSQLPLARLQQFVIDNDIRTVVCLRDVKDPVDPADQQEEVWVKAKGLKFVRIPPRPWYPDAGGTVPAELSVQAFRKVMDDPANHPVLVHCFAGIHRTGIMCAVFRMDYQNWTKDEAMREMRILGYSVLDDHEDVQAYLLYHHRPRTTKSSALPLEPVAH